VSRRPPRSAQDGPRPLSASLDALVEDLGDVPGLGGTRAHDARALGALFGAWADIVGPAMARHVAVLRWDPEALVVTADHPAWATKTRLLSADILEGVTQATGYHPGRLEVVVQAR
jgi:predicted nucleic acid-binding Zn ribbon protein